MRLKDKVCIITGGAKGMGRIRCYFAKEGASVVAADILAKEGDETANLVRANGGDAAFVQADVSKAADVERMVKFAVDKYRKINVLYNNPGISLPQEDWMITDLDEGIWDKTLDINLKSVYLCCKYTIPEMIKCGGGSIINTASAAAIIGLEMPAYSASKGGVVALTRSIAREYGNKNIRVNAICPGPVDTPMYAALTAFRAKRPPQVPYGPILLGRTAQPEEIVSLGVYLASDESSYVTGATFIIDAGFTAV